MAVMVVAATRPVVALAEKVISFVARLMPMPEGLSFYLAALSIGLCWARSLPNPQP